MLKKGNGFLAVHERNTLHRGSVRLGTGYPAVSTEYRDTEGHSEPDVNQIRQTTQTASTRKQKTDDQILLTTAQTVH